MTSITSEIFHEVELHIGPYYIDILIEGVEPILHIVLVWNENLQRGEKWTSQDSEKMGV